LEWIDIHNTLKRKQSARQPDRRERERERERERIPKAMIIEHEEGSLGSLQWYCTEM
jgi:hypothetical protein